MKNLQEESKDSTSSEEPEYESDIHSEKSIESNKGAPRLKISLYLSTDLITWRNLTLADITIEKYPASKIQEMESELIAGLKYVKLKPLLIDPRADMKKQKKAGNTNTLVEYDKIGMLCD